MNGYLISQTPLLVSYCIIYGNLIALIIIYFSFDEVEHIWFCSKILTIKNIIEKNNNSNLLYSFTSLNNFSVLSKNYYDLLNLTRGEGCKENYKQCGILDTIGNKLCIEEFYFCPMNKMIIDLKSKQNDYLNQEYLVGNIKNLNYKYNLYYSNNFINGTSINIIKKSKNCPKFITEDDFILDIDEIQKYFSKLKLTEIKNNNIKRRVNLLEVNNDDEELYNNIIFITNKKIIID